MNNFSSFSTDEPPVSGFGKKSLGADPLHLAALSGASPTAYFVWRQVMENASNSKCNTDSEDEELPSLSRSYNDLHMSTFQSFEENELNNLVENSPMAELNKQDHNGNSPLAWAASEGREDIVTLLR
jgi:ankyrin repeat protein